MFMHDDGNYGPFAPLPVSGLQEEKRQKQQSLFPFNHSSLHPSSSSPDDPHATLLTHLSTLVPPPSTSTPSPSADSTSSSPTQSVEWVDHHVAYYQHYLSSIASSLSSRPSSSHLRAIHSQLSTFILLHHLRTAESPPSPPPPPLDPQFSHRHAVLNLISSSASLTRSLAVVEWLEELAEAGAVFEAEGSVTWRRTLRRIQRGGGEEHLGVDSELVKGTKVFEDGDREDEQALLRYVWAFMRAGKVQQAVQLCVESKQPWRAASLSGGQLWHNEGAADGDHPRTFIGHRRHFLFKRTCREVARHSKVGPYERAIYGLLASDLNAVLGVCHTWEDCVWAMLRVMVDRAIDGLLSRTTKDESERQLAHSTTASPPITPPQIFHRLSQGDDSIPPAAKHAATDFYHHLQSLLVLGDYEEAEAFTAERVRRDEGDEDLLPFAVHLYLYLHPQGPTTPLNENGRVLFIAYIHQLQRRGHHHLIPLYSSYLSHSDQVHHYGAFLRTLPTVSERYQFLQLAQSYFPATVLRITTVLVQGLIEEKGEGGRDGAMDGEERWVEEGGVRSVSASDRELIESLDCFRVSIPSTPAALLEAVRLSNFLFRAFVRGGRLDAAKRLSETRLMKDFDEFISMEERAEEKVDEGEQTLRYIEHEFVGWKLYISAMRWLSTWSDRLALKPQPPQPIQASAGRTAQQERSDQRRWERELAKHAALLEEWRAEWDKVSTATVNSLLSCLQQGGRGWMKEAGPEGEEWRRLLVPSLLFQLHRVYEVCERGKEVLQVVELVVDERYQLYEVMDLEERRALLIKVKDSYVLHVLRPEEERRRSINTGEEAPSVSPPAPELDAREEEVEHDYELTQAEQDHKYDEEEAQEEEPMKAPVVTEPEEEPEMEGSTEAVQESDADHQPRSSPTTQPEPVILADESTHMEEDQREMDQGELKEGRAEEAQVSPVSEVVDSAPLTDAEPQLDSHLEPVVEEPSPSPPRDEEKEEPRNPPISPPPAPEVAPPSSSPPPASELNPFQADEAPPLLPPSLPAVEEESERPTRRSSRPRRGASASRSVERELKPPSRAASVEEEGTPSPLSEAASTDESKPQRKAARTRSRRVSKPVEPSTRVLRTRK